MDLEPYCAQVTTRVKLARVRLNMTQEEVAAVGVVGVRHYQRIESGKTQPNVSVLFILSRVFDTCVDELTTERPLTPAENLAAERRLQKKKVNWKIVLAARQRVAADVPKKSPKRRKKPKPTKPRK